MKLAAFLCMAVVVAVVACGKSDSGGKDKPSGKDQPKAMTKGNEAKGNDKPATTPSSSTKAPDNKTVAASGDGDAKAAACQKACEHRKSCSVEDSDDVAKCAADCKLMADQFTTDALATYTKASCDEAKQGEANFQTAVLCRRACRHRASCLPGADNKICEADCAGLVAATGQKAGDALNPYLASDCTKVKSEEAGFQLAASCLRACVKAVQCGARNELKSCLGECAQSIQKGEFTAAKARELAQQSCEQVKAIVKPLRTTARPVARSRSGMGCRSSGAQDCPYFSVCCRGSAYTRPGSGPGICISPAICLMPTR